MGLPQVLILGGGFAGLAAARVLRGVASDKRCTVWLLDRKQETAMIPALPDYTARLMPADWVTAPIQSQLPPQIRFEQSEVRSVSLETKIVETSSGSRPYDYLILGWGSRATPSPTDWEQERLHTLATLEDAQALRQAISEQIERTGTLRLVISGAGYTGVELAISLARQARRDAAKLQLTIVEQFDGIMPFLSKRQRQRVLASLDRHGVVLKTGCHILSVTRDGVQLSDGTDLPGASVCRTEGTCAPLLPTAPLLENLKDGRICVRPDLSVDTGASAFAAGDAAAIADGNRYLRKAVNFAIYTGSTAGKNVARRLQGKPTRAFHPVDLGWVIPLGDDSVGQAFGKIPLAGKPGLWLHYVMCGYRNYTIRNFCRFTGHAVRAGRNAKRKDAS